MNYSVLIAEDEPVELEALSLFLQRSFPEILRIETARNGLEMEEKLSCINPDIIITDIEMPGLNGLKVMSRIREGGCNSKLIVQTAFSDFTFARRAIEVDADAYMLKPIKKRELKEKIESLIRNIEEERQLRIKRRRDETLLEESSELIEERIITALRKGRGEDELFNLYCNHLQLHPAGCHMVFIARNPEKETPSPNGADIFIKAVERASAELRNEGLPVIAKSVESDRLAFLIGVNGSSPLSMKMKALIQVRQLIERIEENYPGPLRAGIGGVYTYPGEYHCSYQEGIHAFHNRSGEHTIVHIDEIDHLQKNASQLLIEDGLINTIEHIIFETNEGPDQDLLITLMEQKIFPNLATIDIGRDRVLILLLELHKNQPAPIAPDFLEKLDGCMNLEELKECLLSELNRLASLININRRGALHPSIKQAIEHIDSHYMKDLSLELVADEAGVSPCHLSHLFKKELGKTYIEYLTERRITSAREMVKQKRYTMKELCQRAGYRNLAYFTKVFLARTGMEIKEHNGVAVTVDPESVKKCNTAEGSGNT